MPAFGKKQSSDTTKVPKARAPRMKAKAATAAGPGPPESLPEAAGPGRGAIASRAFELYLQDGRVDGRDLDHWLRAERELNGSPKE